MSKRKIEMIMRIIAVHALIDLERLDRYWLRQETGWKLQRNCALAGIEDIEEGGHVRLPTVLVHLNERDAVVGRALLVKSQPVGEQ